LIFYRNRNRPRPIHFLIHSVLIGSPTKIIRTLKSITAKEIFKNYPYVIQKLWVVEFWSTEFYVNTVGKHRNENTIQNYAKSQD
jgi:REP element-mobilizing transposase RayT